MFEESVNEEIGVADKTWKRMNKWNHILTTMVSLVVELRVKRKTITTHSFVGFEDPLQLIRHSSLL